MEGRYRPFQRPLDGNETGFNHTQYGMMARVVESPTVNILRYLSEVYLSLPIALLGILGNIVTLIVLCSSRRLQKLHTIIIQLQAMAVIDTFILIFTILLRSLRYIAPVGYVSAHAVMYLFLTPLVYYLRLASVWLTVLLTVDRYIAVWYPLDAKRLCTVSRTYILIVLINVVAFLFNIPRFFEFTLSEFKQNGVAHLGFTSAPLLNNQTYNLVYRIVLFIALQYVIPTLALVCLNVCVIVALRRSDIYRSTTANRPRPLATTFNPSQVVGAGEEHVTSSAPVAAFQSARSVTTVVVVIVTICIVVHIVALTAHVVWSAQLMAGVPSNATDPVAVAKAAEEARRTDTLRRHLAQASNVLVTLNSAINFLVYCMFSRNFRSLLVRRFCPSRAVARCWARLCCRAARSRRRSEGDSSKRSTTTNHSEARTNATSIQHFGLLQVNMAGVVVMSNGSKSPGVGQALKL